MCSVVSDETAVTLTFVAHIHHLIRGESAVSLDMALRLSSTLGRTAESWMAMQAQYDLWGTKQSKLKKINFDDLDKAA